MQSLSRRQFMAMNASLLFAFCASSRNRNDNTSQAAGNIFTVNGIIPASAMGLTLAHEHFLVDFIGADKINNDRWNVEDVIRKVSPYVTEVKGMGVQTMLDCTPAYLGRDVRLLQQLSKQTGVNIITNTGYYGAMQNKFLPAHAIDETAEQLAARWTDEFRKGIDGTDVRPGFIKISVDGPTLSLLHQKIVRAACITHLETGLTICSHTGKADLAFQQLNIVDEMKVNRDAFVWVHAQAEDDEQQYVAAARSGAWVSLDGFGEESLDKYLSSLATLRSAGLLSKVLLSHDAGWYRPGERDGGNFTPYTRIFSVLIPALKKNGFTQEDVELLFQRNPRDAFAVVTHQ